MTSDLPLPEDPFQDNPFELFSQRMTEAVDDGHVSYFDLFPNVSMHHLYTWAGDHLDGSVDPDVYEGLSLGDRAMAFYAGLLIHGVMVGGAIERGEAALNDLLGEKPALG